MGLATVLVASLLSVQAAGAASADEPQTAVVAGILCFGGEPQKCTPTSGAEVIAGSATESGRFTWRTADRRELAIGIAEREKPVNLTTLSPGRVRFTYKGSPPEKAVLTLSSDHDQWPIPISRADIEGLKTIHVPKGTYSLRIAADGYHPIFQPNLKVESIPVALPQVTFVLYPRIYGTVMRKDGPPVVDAAVISSDQVVARTDDAGAFSFRPAAKIPREILVSSPRFAPKAVAIFYTGADEVAVGQIVLAPGAALTVSIDRKCEPCPMTASLWFLASRDAGARRMVASRNLPSDRNELIYEDLASGAYLLILAGPKAIATKTVRINVVDGEHKKERVAVTSLPIEGSVALGTVMLPGARVHFTSLDGFAESETQTTLDGLFSIDLWQEGQYTVEVTGPGLTEAFALRKDLLASTKAFDIIIPLRTINGHVFDAATQAPIAGALVVTQYLGEEIAQSGLRFTTDSAGRFVVPNARPGQYTFQVETTANYVSGPPRRIRIESESEDVAIDIPLSRSDHALLRMVNESGQPVADAYVLSRVFKHGIDADPPYVTGPDGIAEVACDPGQIVLIYIVTGSGCLKVVRMTSPGATEQQTRDVIVPEGTASLIVRILGSRGEPLSGKSILMQYNGELIPPIVTRYLALRQQLVSESASDGRIAVGRLPAGQYRFWAFHSVADLLDIYSSPLSHGAPASIELKEGQYALDLVQKDSIHP